MILLISQSGFEYTTDLVFDWIENLGGKVIRLNGSDLLKEDAFKVELTRFGMSVSIKNIPLEDIKIVWYRRWYNTNFSPLDNDAEINRYLLNEFKGLSQFVFYALKDKKWYNRHDYFKPFPTKIGSAEKLKPLYL
jgi:hypothetical protein